MTTSPITLTLPPGVRLNLTPPATPPAPLRLSSAPVPIMTDAMRTMGQAVVVTEPSTFAPEQAISPRNPRVSQVAQVVSACRTYGDAFPSALPATTPLPVLENVSGLRSVTPPPPTITRRPASADVPRSEALGVQRRAGQVTSVAVSGGGRPQTARTQRDAGSSVPWGSTLRGGTRFASAASSTLPVNRCSKSPERAPVQKAWAEIFALKPPLTDPVERTPDIQRLRHSCKMLVDVVNEIEDATLRRVMVFYMEELLSACFKDYIRTYDPKKEPLRQGRGRYPRLSEEQLSNLIPYFSVVQNLRDTAKDAILRKIELEAKASDTAADLTQSEERRTLDEVRLKEELRHARLLADTLQARTIELEKTRLGLEEQVRRGNLEREKEELAKKRLGNEVRRLRADAEMVRIAKASMDAERQASMAAATAAATGRRSGAGAGTSASSTARPESARARPTTTSNSSSFGRAPRLDPFGGSRSSTGQEPTPRRTTGPALGAGRVGSETERQRRPEPRAPQRRPVGAAGPAAPRTEVEAPAAGGPDAEDAAEATTSNASDSLTALRADGRSPQNHSRKTSNASTSSIRGPGRGGAKATATRSQSGMSTYSSPG